MPKPSNIYSRGDIVNVEDIGNIGKAIILKRIYSLEDYSFYLALCNNKKIIIGQDHLGNYFWLTSCKSEEKIFDTWNRKSCVQPF